MTTLLEAIPGLKAVLDYFSQERRRREDHADAALSALCEAANRTKIYLARLERGASRVRATEGDLSLLWNRSAVALHRVNTDLAERCMMKAEYWIQPERWSEADIKRARIGIKEVYDETKRLIVAK